MDTSLIINSITTAGKKGTKAISNINPEKDNETLQTFAQMVNGLSTNSYVDATRVDKTSVKEQHRAGSATFTVTLHTEEPGQLNACYVDYETIEGGVRLKFDLDEYIDVILR